MPDVKPDISKIKIEPCPFKLKTVKKEASRARISVKKEPKHDGPSCSFVIDRKPETKQIKRESITQKIKKEKIKKEPSSNPKKPPERRPRRRRRKKRAKRASGVNVSNRTARYPRVPRTRRIQPRDPRGRISRALGIEADTSHGEAIPHALPSIRRFVPVEDIATRRASAGINGLSLFGHELNDHGESPLIDENATNVHPRNSVRSSTRNTRPPNQLNRIIPAPICPNITKVDLLGDILEKQKVLMASSSEVVIQKDGTLKLANSSNLNTSLKKSPAAQQKSRLLNAASTSAGPNLSMFNVKKLDLDAKIQPDKSSKHFSFKNSTPVVNASENQPFEMPGLKNPASKSPKKATSTKSDANATSTIQLPKDLLYFHADSINLENSDNLYTTQPSVEVTSQEPNFGSSPTNQAINKKGGKKSKLPKNNPSKKPKPKKPNKKAARKVPTSKPSVSVKPQVNKKSKEFRPKASRRQSLPHLDQKFEMLPCSSSTLPEFLPPPNVTYSGNIAQYNPLVPLNIRPPIVDYQPRKPVFDRLGPRPRHFMPLSYPQVTFDHRGGFRNDHWAGNAYVGGCGETVWNAASCLQQNFLGSSGPVIQMEGVRPGVSTLKTEEQSSLVPKIKIKQEPPEVICLD